MDDPLGLSNSFQHASPGSAVLDAECLATLGEELRDVTRAAVQHHPLDGDTDAEEARTHLGGHAAPSTCACVSP